MVSISSRKTAGLGGRGMIILVTCFLFACGIFYSSNLQNCDLTNISAGLIATTVAPNAITTWEQLEEQMQKLDPVKAQRWKTFLEKDGKPAVAAAPPMKEEAGAAVLSRSIDSPAELESKLFATNSQRVRDWRSKFDAAAAIENAEEHRRETNKYATNAFQVSNLRKCQFVFLDFGANIGDSLMKLIDAFMPEFDSGLDPDGKKLHHTINSTSGNIGPGVYDYIKRNPNKWILPKWVKQKIEDYNNDRKRKGNRDPVYPEDYCYYGVEGNPHFTSLLRGEEIQFMNMVPRPVRHMHFLTEHVGAGADGPTTLFLDTTNVKDNFWGSSVLQSHQDVVKSGGNTGTPVMGITLTKLLQDTVLPGGHVMIKIDIEGGEYQLLEEAINSTIFCKLIKEQGVKIDMLNEPHNAKVVGSEEPGNRWKAIGGQKQIQGCGVGYGWGGRQF